MLARVCQGWLLDRSVIVLRSYCGIGGSKFQVPASESRRCGRVTPTDWFRHSGDSGEEPGVEEYL